MKYQLVLQWSLEGDADFDELIAMEDLLRADGDRGLGKIDGHDIGSGEMNIFILTDGPSRAFDRAAQILGGSDRWGTVRAAFRALDSDEFQVVWPSTLQKFDVA